jgi:hypothetical protein
MTRVRRLCQGSLVVLDHLCIIDMYLETVKPVVNLKQSTCFHRCKNKIRRCCKKRAFL